MINLTIYCHAHGMAQEQQKIAIRTKEIIFIDLSSPR